MNDIKQATRKESMKQNFDIQDLPKSGFNLTYNSHIGGIPMGRMIPTAYQYIMAGDKFSGRNDYEFIAEHLSTPVVSDVRVSVHNFFTTFRSIDKGFEELQTPTKLNSMSANVSTPQFRLYDVVKELLIELHELFPATNTAIDSAYQDFVLTNCKLLRTPSYAFDFEENRLLVLFDPSTAEQSGWIYILRNCAIAQALKNVYLDDSIEDLIEQLRPIADAINKGPGNFSFVDWLTTFQQFYSGIFDFFCGEGSLMDYFGAPIFSHEDVLEWLAFMGDVSNNQNYDFSQPDNDWASGESLMYYNLYTIDRRYIWEYPFRAYYAIWFEHYRNMWLEPRSANLPEYSDFGSTPLIQGYGSNVASGIATLLVTRIMPWTDDPFNTSQIDDISRHVYAPIVDLSLGSNRNSYSSPSVPAQDNASATSVLSNTGNLWSQTTLRYVDAFGQAQYVTCPLPDALSNIDLNYLSSNVSTTSQILDLFTLKKAKMIERFLKRNFAFGDEYRDRLKAQYGVTIEDYRINRPHYLSGSVDKVDIKQEVANTGAPAGQSSGSGIVEQGSRLATGSVSNTSNTDGFTFFATEFGIYISLTSICPAAQYNHTDPVLFTQKMQDFPIPVFAMQQEDINNSSEMYRTGFNVTGTDNLPFGHVPYAHGWRYRIDEVHGQMLSSKYDYTFARFYRGLTNDGVPKLNYWFLHCRPNLPMFTNSILLDGQFYGTTKHSFLVERLLPQPVESI